MNSAGMKKQRKSKKHRGAGINITTGITLPQWQIIENEHSLLNAKYQYQGKILKVHFVNFKISLI